ncbi:GIY-YIG nuclease family protein [Thiomicrorhabdus cannonii]|uniref:GIY-YIG nuclease family protein n=1 Tax=Thiomicrorhabdus cannonii TaxID=2748011 RepID=UPI0015BFAF4C|nr:GIY-YIG nuclease family protein [Thiomicrorhabdus cannonii]
MAAEKTQQAGCEGWCVYLLRCADQTLYCGITNQLQKRLRQHNGELKGGARYTQARRPCELVYQEAADNRQAALQREYAIKQLSKAQKEALLLL